MKTNPKRIKGETLLETVIALAILAIGITFSGTIIGLSLRNITVVKNRIIAVNAARGGVEAMRNIRDTNWLKFNSQRRLCWNHLPAINPTTPCDGTSPIQPGQYIVYKQEGTSRWILGPLIWSGLPILDNSGIPDPTTYTGDYYHNSDTGRTYKKVTGRWEDISSLYIVDIDAFTDTDLDNDYENDEDAYNHAITQEGDALGGSLAKKTGLNRILTIEYIANDGTVITSGVGVEHNRMRITSTVTFIRGGKEFKSELITHITDYLGRENLSN